MPEPVPVSIPEGSVDTFGFVHVPVWWWLPDADWQPLTGSASDAGITVTVTATPLRSVWDPGDGKPEAVCAGPGIEWRPSLDIENGTYCSHTYTRSSDEQPGLSYTAEVTVEWEFSWTINGVAQGPFGLASPSAEFPYAVGEIQAIES